MALTYQRTIEITPDGELREDGPRTLPWPMKIGLFAVCVAAVAGLFAVASLAIWIFSVVLPVALVGGIVAWVAFRVQLWRTRGRPRAFRAGAALRR